MRNRIPNLTILLNNGVLGDYGGMIPVATERYGTRYLSGDYALVAKRRGAYAERIERPEEIVPAVERAKKVLAEGRPALLEMMTREETQVSKYWLNIAE